MKSEGKFRIIEAAQRLIAEQGVEKTSMRQIAEAAELTTGAIYYYYKSKEALLYDVMDYATAITANIIQMRRSTSAGPAEVLDEIARMVAQRITDSQGRRLRYYLAYQAAQGDETLRAKFSSDYAAQVERTSELFNYVFSTTPNDQDRCLAVLMIAALDGINLQQFIGALPVDEAELARTYNEFFAYAVPLFQQHIQEIHRFGGHETD
jgi:AcrR family transcriptional regulator